MKSAIVDDTIMGQKKPVYVPVWSLPQGSTRDKELGLSRVEALAVIPKKNAVVVARDRCLELWQLHVSRHAAAQKTNKVEQVKCVQLPANASPHELDRAAVRQILWLPWLSAFLVLMRSDIYLYKRDLSVLAQHTLSSRHLLCACAHTGLREVVVSTAGGVLMRLGFSSTVEYQGVGLGSGKTVRRHRLHVLHSWSVLLQKVDSSASVHRSSFASSPSSSARPEGRERNSGKWVWSLFSDQACDRVVGASGCDVFIWKWSIGACMLRVREVEVLDAHKQPVTTCILTREAPYLLITGSCDTTIKVWKLSGSEATLLDVLGGHAHAVYGLQLDAPANMLYSFGDDGNILSWDLASLTLVSTHCVTMGETPPLARALQQLRLGQKHQTKHHTQMESLHLAARAKGNTGSGRILLFPMEDQQSLIAVISGTEVHFLQITYRVQLASASLGPIRRAALVSSSLLELPSTMRLADLSQCEGSVLSPAPLLSGLNVGSESRRGQRGLGSSVVLQCTDDSVQILSSGSLQRVLNPGVSNHLGANEGGRAAVQGPMCVCEVDAVSGLIVCGWPSGLVRLMDAALGQCVKEYQSDRSMLDAYLCSACILPIPAVTDMPSEDDMSGGQPSTFVQWTVVRGRSDGVLQVLREGGRDDRGFEVGKSKVVFLKWLNSKQFQRLFSQAVHKRESSSISQIGALVAASSEGTFFVLDAQLPLTCLLKFPTNSQGNLVTACVAPSHGGSIICGFATGTIEVWSIFDADISNLHTVFREWAEEARRSSRSGEALPGASWHHRGIPEAPSSPGDVCFKAMPKHARLVLNHHFENMQLLCSPDGRSMVSCSPDRGVAEWDLNLGVLCQTYIGAKCAGYAEATMQGNSSLSLVLYTEEEVFLVPCASKAKALSSVWIHDGRSQREAAVSPNQIFQQLNDAEEARCREIRNMTLRLQCSVRCRIARKAKQALALAQVADKKAARFQILGMMAFKTLSRARKDFRGSLMHQLHECRPYHDLSDDSDRPQSPLRPLSPGLKPEIASAPVKISDPMETEQTNSESKAGARPGDHTSKGGGETLSVNDDGGNLLASKYGVPKFLQDLSLIYRGGQGTGGQAQPPCSIQENDRDLEMVEDVRHRYAVAIMLHGPQSSETAVARSLYRILDSKSSRPASACGPSDPTPSCLPPAPLRFGARSKIAPRGVQINMIRGAQTHVPQRPKSTMAQSRVPISARKGCMMLPAATGPKKEYQTFKYHEEAGALSHDFLFDGEKSRARERTRKDDKI